MGLRIVSRKDIDDSKWNACVANAAVSLPYAYSWYLDVVAEGNWRGVVLKDYVAVFPLPIGKKFGIEYVYQPFFCQQLGLYSANPHIGLEDICLKLISKKFLYASINLNYLSALEIDDKFSGRKNYILPLGQPYEELSRKYSQSQTRNIGKARQAGLVIDYHATDTEQFATLFEKNSTATMDTYKAKHTAMLARLAFAVLKNSAGELCVVKSQSGEIMAMNLLVFSGSRIINLAPVTTPAGRNCGAMHFLLDSYIKRFAGSDKILDFEGSSLPSVAKFYERFGAGVECFYTYRQHFLQPVTQLLRFT